MDILDNEIQTDIPKKTSSGIHWGHFGLILGAAVLLLGMSWLEKPELFSLHPSPVAVNPNAPHYYAYVAPAVPQVLGASTDPSSADQGPMLINEDGSVSPVADAGQVLGANTQEPDLNVDNILVNTIPDSDNSLKNYLTESQTIEVGPIDGAAFETALSSNDQNLINQQAQKLIGVRDALQKLPTPQGLVNFAKLTIVQYNAAIGLLQNFTLADQNPGLVADDLQEFMASQMSLQNESTADEQKYNLDPSLFTIGDIQVASSTLSDLQAGVANLSQQTQPDPSGQADDSNNSLSDDAQQ